ncbi:MAG: hypothetical protein RML94_15740 [Bacteroidia bacterium]|nr:hypothetical protein [Bacteroidia bacterium]
MSFFMTLYAKILLEDQRKERNTPDLSIADIKTLYHVHFHYEYLLKYISQQPEKCFLFPDIHTIIPPDIIHNR